MKTSRLEFGVVRWTQMMVLASLLLSSGAATAATIKDGRLMVDGQWVFLKTACPLANFAVENIEGYVDVLVSKGYNNIKINLYWDHFDTNGDGLLDNSLAKLNSLIEHIHSKGIFAALSFETYNVGGGGVPVPFFETHPDAQARNSSGALAFDGEYGTGKKIPSIFHPAYLEASRGFMKEILAGVDTNKLIYFETTVEPQFIGNQELDHSDAGKVAWQAYCQQENMGNCPWPPGGASQWQTFRARALAEWIMGDAAAIREVAGVEALIAVDYLETGGNEMENRNGDSMTFLNHLQGVDILQCNWHWLPGSNKAFELTYQRANSLKGEKGWATTEHMTVNGNDFMQADIAAVLQHTLDSGNQFGWEIVNTRPISSNPFTVYNDDWSPKSTIAELDNNHGSWMSKAYGGAGEAYEGIWVGQSDPKTMESGEVAQVHLVYLNTGTSAWDTVSTRIGTTEPQDMESPFYDPGDWLSPNRTTAVDSPTQSGQHGTFSFTLRAPEVDQPTEIIQHWGIVQEGVTWFGPPQDAVWFKVLVTPEGYIVEPDVVSQPDVASTPDVVVWPEVVEGGLPDLFQIEALPEVVSDSAADQPSLLGDGAGEIPVNDVLKVDLSPMKADVEAIGSGSGGGCQMAGAANEASLLLSMLLALLALLHRRGRSALRDGPFQRCTRYSGCSGSPWQRLS